LAERIQVYPKSVERSMTQDRMLHATTRVRVAKVLGQEETYFWPPVEHRPKPECATLAERVQFWPSRSAVPGDVWRSPAGRSKRRPPKHPQIRQGASPDVVESDNAKAAAYAALYLAALLEVQGDNSGAPPLIVMPSSKGFPRSAWGHRLIPERGRFTGLACIALAPGCILVNHPLTSGFAAVHPSWAAVV
jgi:hypothetical protein